MTFYDHVPIETSNGKREIIVNDKQWPEGLRFALGKMRKGEEAKIKIKKSYGWGSTIDPELLRTPETCLEGEMKERLHTKGIIYVLTLHDWDI
jgi:FKBP-type peptidyl-prolyl cis-trans isomerase 2